jgi:hypothetical protein
MRISNWVIPMREPGSGGRGNLIIDGKQVAGFSNAEEAAAGLTGVVPYLLQDELVKSGADEQPVASFRMMIDISRPN